MNIIIEPVKLFLIIFVFTGFILSAFMMFGLIMHKSKPYIKLLFILLFFNFTLFEIYFVFYKLKLFTKEFYYPLFYIIPLYLTGPVLLFVYKAILIKDFKISWKMIFHLLPAIIAGIYIIFAEFFILIEPTGFLLNFFSNRYALITGIIGEIVLLVYLVRISMLFVSQYLLNFRLIIQNKALSMAFIVYFLFCIIWILDVTTYFTRDVVLINIPNLLLTLAIVVLFFMHFRYYGLYQSIHAITEDGVRKRSYITNLSMNEIDIRINDLLNNQKLYTDENLTLPLLASRMDITVHQLSEFINSMYKKNFSSLINEFRLKEAAEILEKHMDKSILEVAFEAGFKSKSSFNSLFKKHFNITPAEYRKNKLTNKI